MAATAIINSGFPDVTIRIFVCLTHVNTLAAPFLSLCFAFSAIEGGTTYER